MIKMINLIERLTKYTYCELWVDSEDKVNAFSRRGEAFWNKLKLVGFKVLVFSELSKFSSNFLKFI